MDVRFTADTPGEGTDVFAVLADLTTYPRWLDLVSRVQPAEAHPDDGGPAWFVDLRARLGPLARAKRLRMVRTVHEPVERVVHTRVEVDGRQHSSWTLTATVHPGAGHNRVAVHLHYGGGLWLPAFEPILARQAEQAVPRLRDLVADPPH
jgi:hypothetical protein